jgi:hypothetical protein
MKIGRPTSPVFRRIGDFRQRSRRRTDRSLCPGRRRLGSARGRTRALIFLRGRRCRFAHSILISSSRLRFACQHPPHAQQKLPAIAAAISGDGGELLPMPRHHQTRTDADRRFQPQARPRDRHIFNRRRSADRRSIPIGPRDLRHRPHHFSWLDAAPIHAISIGGLLRRVKLREAVDAARRAGAANHAGFASGATRDWVHSVMRGPR